MSSCNAKVYFAEETNRSNCRYCYRVSRDTFLYARNGITFQNFSIVQVCDNFSSLKTYNPLTAVLFTSRAK